MRPSLFWLIVAGLLRGILAALLLGILLAAAAMCEAGEPVAYVLVGGSARQNAFPAGVATWRDGPVLWAIENGPKLKAAGFTRVAFWNPGGIFFKGWLPDDTSMETLYGPTMAAAWKRGLDPREMWADQWLLAEACKCRHANRDELALAHALLRYYGVKEIIYYLGSPSTLRDPLVDGKRCVEPFMWPGASLAFDATADQKLSGWREGDRICQLFDWLRALDHKVYVEARLEPDAPELARHIDGTIALASFDASEFHAPAFKVAAKYGEVLQIVDKPFAVAAGVTPVKRDWSK